MTSEWGKVRLLENAYRSKTILYYNLGFINSICLFFSFTRLCVNLIPLRFFCRYVLNTRYNIETTDFFPPFNFFVVKLP